MSSSQEREKPTRSGALRGPRSQASVKCLTTHHVLPGTPVGPTPAGTPGCSNQNTQWYI